MICKSTAHTPLHFGTGGLDKLLTDGGEPTRSY
jgi:hypothetical protein